MELCSYNPHNCECRRQPDYKLVETDTGKEGFCCSEHERSYRDLNRRYGREYFVIVKLPASGQRTKTTAELESELSSLRRELRAKENDLMRREADFEWECPKCGFAMNKVHFDETESEPCPVCSESELRAQVEELKAALRQIETKLRFQEPRQAHAIAVKALGAEGGG